MKRFWATLLLLTTILGLTGCGNDNAETRETPVPTAEQPEMATVAPAATFVSQLAPAPVFDEPIIEATPTPFPVVEPTDYVFIWKVNDKIKLKYQVPSHWEELMGEHTAVFTEPVPEGEVPARVAFSTYRVGRDESSDRMKEHLKKLLKSISEQYTGFSFEDINRKAKYIRYYGYSTYYTAQKDGEEYKGYVIICNIGRYIHSFHFSATLDKFDLYKDIAVKILNSVTKDE